MAVTSLVLAQPLIEEAVPRRAKRGATLFALSLLIGCAVLRTWIKSDEEKVANAEASITMSSQFMQPARARQIMHPVIPHVQPAREWQSFETMAMGSARTGKEPITSASRVWRGRFRSDRAAVRVQAEALEGLSAKDVTTFSKDNPFPATFESMEAIATSETGTTYNIVLSTKNAEKTFNFLEGQVIALYVNYKEPDEKPNMMFLSIASSRYGDALDGHSLTLCVMVKAGRDNYFGSLAKGQEVMLTGPFGKAMLLPADVSKDLVLISVGTGIAPYRAFAKRLFVDDSPAKAAFTAKATVITTAESRADLVYADEFEAIASRSGGRFAYDASIGGSILEKIDASGATLVDCLKNGGHIYIAGPLKAIMDDVVAALKKSSADAEELIETAKSDGRWHVEVY